MVHCSSAFYTLTNEELSRKRHDCDLCGSPLWRVKAERGW